MASSRRKSLVEGCGECILGRRAPTDKPRREPVELGDRPLELRFSDERLLVRRGVRPPSGESGGIVWIRDGTEVFSIP